MEDLVARLRALERQVVALRSALAAESGPLLPDQPFWTLEIQAGSEWYLFPTEPVAEVAAMVWCEPIPESPAWAIGSFSYRGRSVVAIDLAQRLGGEATPISPSLVMVLMKPPAPIALVVRAVGELTRVDPGDVQPLPGGVPAAPFLLGWLSAGEHQRHLISPAALQQYLIIEGPSDD